MVTSTHSFTPSCSTARRANRPPMAPEETMRNSGAPGMAVALAVLATLGLVAAGFAQTAATQNSGETQSPWTARQTMQPETLAAQFLQKNSVPQPIVCVGFGPL